ncbi:MAG TPA: tetratricopeptide repeat protein [Spirochaetes bacterium]|nr:tetratricopeptide repeat protein [Spirochaetota bacterium]
MKRITFLILSPVIFIIIIIVPLISLASFQEGYDLYKKGKYYEAEKILLREKELSPRNLDIYAVLGWCYLYTGRYRSAIGVSQEGLDFSPRDTRFLTTMGRSYFELKRYRDAIGYLESAASFDPENAYNYFYLGRIFLAQGKLILAETAFSASIKLMNDKYVFYKYRGDVYERMSDFKAAEKDYKKALGLKPSDPKLKESLIKVISKQVEMEDVFE